ncbi:hypothetical protein [Myxococcus llanfairpwllgwyngyllgogerychwyrndrobwllllantysiliogogogochensis]|uniref:hypothetical protein n=1 Tax=Myxococcus llanfairpwllgwyngyllgogerychwyrndrobwllllantysiliogogogochensis TaxID=2590453 RepID=UPI001FE8837C|nr:hypothetical protein [Myxococcus llanfairpwllgwyngyllgogerychwyrndrobwllllantysiliogogogochensis]
MLKRLLENPVPLLRDLDMPCRDAAQTSFLISSFLVPRQSEAERWAYYDGETEPAPALADTGFVSGPEVNLVRYISTTWAAGYEHPAAGAIHEGFHWDEQTINPPPHFLKKGFRKARGAARKGVARVVKAYLAKHFPSH